MVNRTTSSRLKLTGKIFLVAVLALAYVNAASAASLDYDVRSAHKRKYGISEGGHAIVIANIGSLIFNPTGNLLVSDNQWHMTGTVQGAGNTKFIVDLLYSDIVDYQSAVNQSLNVVKKELKPNAYAPNGPIDPTTWLFAKNMTGTLTGVAGSVFDGVVLSLSLRGELPQMGYGANGKNPKFGLSNWFTAAVIQNAHGLSLQHSYVGDVNVKLTGVEVPEPASVLLLGLALAMLVLVKARKKQTV